LAGIVDPSPVPELNYIFSDLDPIRKVNNTYVKLQEVYNVLISVQLELLITKFSTSQHFSDLFFMDN